MSSVLTATHCAVVNAAVLAVLFRGLDMVRQLIVVTAAQVQGKPMAIPSTWTALLTDIQQQQVQFHTQLIKKLDWHFLTYRVEQD